MTALEFLRRQARGPHRADHCQRDLAARGDARSAIEFGRFENGDVEKVVSANSIVAAMRVRRRAGRLLR